MLVFSRKHRESVVIGKPDSLGQMLKITVLKVTGSKVDLGFEVPKDTPVHRWEVWQRIALANGWTTNSIVRGVARRKSTPRADGKDCDSCE